MWGDCVTTLSGIEVATLSCIPIIIQNIVNALVVFAGIICIFLIIISGYKFVTSEGDPEKVTSARKTLLYALGGFLLVLISFVLINLIASFTGVTQIAPKQ